MSKAVISSAHQRYISCGPTTKIWDPVRRDWTSGQGLLAKSNYKVSTKWDTEKNCVVAVKSIPVRCQQDVDEAKNEFTLMKQLRHPNILQVLDCVEPSIDPTSTNPGELLIVMKYMANGSILSYLQSLSSSSSEGNLNAVVCPFTEDLICKFFVRLLSALDCLASHGIVHRDIKTENILYDSQLCEAILTDFDRSVQVATDEDAHYTCSWISRLSFTAPELLVDDSTRCYSHKSDMWALGCTMIEIATGKNPWTEKPAWADSGVTDLMMKKLLLEDGKTPTIPADLFKSNPVFETVLRQCFVRNEWERWSAKQALQYIQNQDNSWSRLISEELPTAATTTTTVSTLMSNAAASVTATTVTTSEGRPENTSSFLLHRDPLLEKFGVGGPTSEDRHEAEGSAGGKQTSVNGNRDHYTTIHIVNQTEYPLLYCQADHNTGFNVNSLIDTFAGPRSSIDPGRTGTALYTYHKGGSFGKWIGNIFSAGISQSGRHSYVQGYITVQVPTEYGRFVVPMGFSNNSNRYNGAGLEIRPETGMAIDPVNGQQVGPGVVPSGLVEDLDGFCFSSVYTEWMGGKCRLVQSCRAFTVKCEYGNEDNGVYRFVFSQANYVGGKPNG